MANYANDVDSTQALGFDFQAARICCCWVVVGLLSG